MKPGSIVRNDSGAALVLVLGYLAVITTLGAAFFVSVHRALDASLARERHAVCLSLAEGGVEKAIAGLLQHPERDAGEGEAPLGDGFYSVTVERDASTGRYVVIGTGRLGDAQTTLARARVRADVALSAGRVERLRWREEHVR